MAEPAADPRTTDPFGAASLRDAVLSAWAASPARFREDANAEEALATGGYADRLLIELAANAVDAAREAGIPGRVRFRLDTEGPQAQLRAANVGAPLTAAGVSGLASLRASAKRGRAASVGHFGVGFTAVVAVSDDPQVLSATGGVRFSRAGTAAAIAGLLVPELDAEVAARAGQVPVLRLPWPTESAALQDDPIPDGFTTEVRLPLLPGLEAALGNLLDEAGDALLWALPGLMTVEIVLPGRAVRVIQRQDLDDGVTVITQDGTASRYLSLAQHGTIPAFLLADRPVEERDRDRWQLTWVLPEPEDGSADEPGGNLFLLDPQRVVEPVFLGAPTPTDEPLSLPARLVGTFPVDDTRRRLAPGALTEYLLDKAATAYLELFVEVPAQQRLSLVPAAGFPLGPIDAALRAGIVRRLSRAPVLVTVRGDAVVPSSACVVTGITDAAAALLGRAVPGLLLPPRAPAQLEALRVLGVGLLPLADATTALAGIDGDPAFWHDIYDALSDADSEDLANLPVPLSGGGRRIGPAGMLLPGTDSVDVDVLRRAAELAPELRIVHPDAAHPLLARLGAVPADAAALLADPALIQLFHDFREDLEDSDPDPEELRDLAVLALDLVADGAPSGGLLDDVVLTDSTGEAWPAGELLAPGAPLATVLSPDADLPVIGSEWAAYPQLTLARIGVRTGLKIVPVEDADADLPDLHEWWSEVVGDSLPPETFQAIADLDLIDDQKWPELLAMIAADRDALAALHSGPDPSYTRWWLARFALLAGQVPTRWRLPGAVELAGLYPELPVELDRGVATAIGVLAKGEDAVATDPGQLLVRLADPARTVVPGAVPRLTALAVDALERDRDLPLPSAVRTLSGEVVDAADAVVLDQPWFAQVVAAGGLVAGGADPARVARLLELELASESLLAQVMPGEATALSDDQAAAAERAALALGLEFAGLFRDQPLLTCPDLSVRLADSTVHRVAWWGAPAARHASQVGAGALLTDGSAGGLGRAVAYRAGRWSARDRAVAAAVGDPITFAEDGLY